MCDNFFFLRSEQSQEEERKDQENQKSNIITLIIIIIIISVVKTKTSLASCFEYLLTILCLFCFVLDSLHPMIYV